MTWVLSLPAEGAITPAQLDDISDAGLEATLGGKVRLLPIDAEEQVFVAARVTASKAADNAAANEVAGVDDIKGDAWVIRRDADGNPVDLPSPASE